MKFLLTIYILTTWVISHAQTIRIKKDSLGSSVIQFYTTQYGKPDSDVSFINVHENEHTSVEAAQAAFAVVNKYAVTKMKSKNGRFLDFHFRGKSFTVDPNRIYTSKGRLASLKKNSGKYPDSIFEKAAKEVARFASSFIDSFITGKKLVVALHNNTDGKPLSIITYKSGSEAGNAADVYMNLQQDPDNFFLTTDKSFFDFIKQQGFNVVLQNNDKVQDDGSLSVYAGKQHIPYINIEAQVGHIAEQQKMVETVMALIKEKKL